MSSFLNALCEGAEKDKRFKRHGYHFIELIYDLTMDKFCNLPNLVNSLSKNREDENQKIKPHGSDCRLYFKAFLSHISQDFKIRPPAGQLEAETRAAAAMQGLVIRHFHYSLLEIKRSMDRLWSRYNWKTNGVTIVLYFPKSISGRKRGEWLAKNVKKPKPNRLNEKQRIQKIIDQKLVCEMIDEQIEDLADLDFEKNWLWPKTEEQFGISLAKVVSNEKAADIHKQRRSIRNLGEERLKQLILRIFEDIKYDDYRDKEIAAEYGISKATFSRFAGSNWAKAKSAVPDLWHNTANVLSQHEAFREVAIEAGYLKKVESILNKTETDENE